eukprot:CAMPEP_0181289142 /NCGR_PEP_ID=MMETSP1101-20121128/724_1 /TAXON_ID=46948 /ORGANISM="Rhodomonas abbreviata, Strain Caron Lab Isolate" /LENGTH=369 /DNA_ID=CAMNT_0023393343 /DNA_START=548 /DNA_END=1657 /DNA_ORIENTATION=-
MGAEMFKHMALKETGNVVISPLSIFVAVSMATAGTTHGGKAHEELRNMLKHDVVGKEEKVHKWMTRTGRQELTQPATLPGAQVDEGNDVSLKRKRSRRAAECCKFPVGGKGKNIFDAEARPLEGKDPINKWVNTKTNGKVPIILEQPPPGPAVIVNAVFFKGEWGSKFDQKDSTAGEFKGLDGASMPAMMMKKSDKKMLFCSSSTADIAQLPYGKTGRFGAIVALPKTAGPAGLAEMISELFEGGKWEGHVDALEEQHVILQLPRFKAEYGVKSLKSTMQELGVAAAFEQGGHFSRMTPDTSVFVEDIFHKAVIEVNEEGTVAAAATAVVMTRCLPAEPILMTVDRPFVFAVYDLESRSLLFVCKVETV